HAGQGHRFFCVGDDEVFGIQLAVYAVQGFEHLAGAGTTHNDLSTLELVEIKRMRGMAHLHQRVVAGIHGVADAAMVVNLQALKNLPRRWRYLYTAQHAGRVTQTAFRVFYRDGKRPGGRLGLGQPRLDLLEIDVIDGRAFAGHAVMTHGVWTVGADLHFENRLSIHLADRL